MKNNVISIVIDSVIADYFGNKICKISPTPFIDSLAGESIVASKMYSPGPFTDAATRSLFTGRDCMDDYSFFFKYSASPTNHYKIFKENGYETMGIYYPYYITGKNVTDYIDHIYYASGFVYISEWNGVFSYFQQDALDDKLSHDNLILLRSRIKLMFDVWIKFYQDIITDSECAIMIDKCIGEFDVRKALNILSDEYEQFKKHKDAYIYDLLKLGLKHKLASLDNIDCEGYIDREFIKEYVYKRHSKDIKFFDWTNKKANWWRNRPGIRRTLKAIRSCIVNKSLDDLYFIGNWYLCLTSFARMQKLSFLPNWQYEQSSYRHFETAKTAIKKRKTDKPFYLSVHVEEPHNYIACFTYDSQDVKLIDEDFMALRNYVYELGCQFKGDLSYILSLRYVDHYIEKFCNFLKKEDLWDNTTLLICADHGSSYSFYPLRNKHVNCFDEECYHIPMVIRHPGLKGFEFNSFCHSKDILPTLLELVGIPQDPNFRGHSLLNEYKVQDYIITEYPGGGCPDVESKELWLSIRNENYMVAYKIHIYENFDSVRPFAVYNLKNDPNAFYNIRDYINSSDIEYLQQALRGYFYTIKDRTENFIKDLKDNKIAI